MSKNDYLWDGSGDDAELAGLEQQLGAFAHRAPLRAPPPRPPGRNRRTAMVAATVVVVATVAIIAIVLMRRDRGTAPGSGKVALASDAALPHEPGFAYDVHGGQAMCNGMPSQFGLLKVGSWLETEPGATAEVKVADIGDIKLNPGSRLRLVDTGPDQHRLELARGSLSARVVAPPRLFIIDTPVAAAVDLGCAYDMEVDDDGRTHLRVTSGAVSLEGHGLVSWVPWAHEVVAVPGRGPGTPFIFDASAELIAALADFDAGARVWGPEDSLTRVLAAATARDTVTLWNLLTRTTGADRAAVFARLDALAIRPEWVLEEDVLSAQPQALEDWRQSLEGTWSVGP